MSVRVVLIDSGLHASHPHLRDVAARCESWELAPGGGFVRASLDNDVLGHGTAAAAAILELAPGAGLISLKIFEDSWTCPFEHVLRALDFALELDPTLVNLSLGTTEAVHAAQLRPRVAEFGRRAIPLISPTLWRGLPSYPGALEGCEGVMMDAGLERGAPEQRPSGERTYWCAAPYPRELPGLPRDANLVGVSMACANLTGVLARRRLDAEAGA